LSYFLAQSPTKTPGTFPFRKFGPATAAVFEEDEPDAKEIPAASHARRASTAVAGRFAAQPQNTPLPDAHNERGQGLLRRLSLSSNAFMSPTDGKRSPPNAPPNTAVSPTHTSQLPFGRDSKPRRSATLSATDGRTPCPVPHGRAHPQGPL